MSVDIPIREVLVAVERRKGITLRRHATLEDLATSLLYRWPEDDRGKEWLLAQKICLEAMGGVRAPEQARAPFVAAVFRRAIVHVRVGGRLPWSIEIAQANFSKAQPLGGGLHPFNAAGASVSMIAVFLARLRSLPTP
jgi:hypothetical protein